MKVLKVARLQLPNEPKKGPFPPILLNQGRDNPLYESLLVLEVPETSEAVFMIHNIIRGAHSYWP